MMTVFVSGEGHQVVVIFNAHREKVLEESLKVTDSKDKSKSITLAFHARVLGEMKNTPLCALFEQLTF